MSAILAAKDRVESSNPYCFNSWYYFGVADVNGHTYMLL